jgi:hypothetical protein
MTRAPRTYKLEPGSLQERVCQHFDSRPDLHELSATEISQIFGIGRTTITSALKSPIKHGLLAVRRGERRQCFYRKGDGKPVAKVFSLATPLPSDPPAAPLAPTAHGLTAALYNDGELYLHGVQPMDDGGVLLSAAQTAELRAYLLHTGQVSSIASANGGSLT